MSPAPADLDPLSPPLAEFSGRLRWQAALETIYSEPPTQSLRLSPEFPGCNPDMAEDIIWDALELFESTRRPGGRDVLNCTFGYPPDAGIEELVYISHPDANTVVWEMDAVGLTPVLAREFAERSGFVRWVFERETYETDIRGMLEAIQDAGGHELPVTELEPAVKGMELEQALALNLGEIGCREPILPAGTRLTFGFAGDGLLAINGEPDRAWPTRLFTHWSIHAAFERWIRFVHRGWSMRHALGEEGVGVDLSPFTADSVRNNFFLLHESERAACDRAGRELVELLEAGFSEGGTAPGVEVSYDPCVIPAVLS